VQIPFAEDQDMIEALASKRPDSASWRESAQGFSGMTGEFACLLNARSIEAHVIYAASVAVSREHRRAKTDRLDAELLKRAFLGWLRGERDHCKMVAIPTLKDEDAKRPSHLTGY
jgi:hypothetical protein